MSLLSSNHSRNEEFLRKKKRKKTSTHGRVRNSKFSIHRLTNSLQGFQQFPGLEDANSVLPSEQPKRIRFTSGPSREESGERLCERFGPRSSPALMTFAIKRSGVSRSKSGKHNPVDSSIGFGNN